LHPVWYERATHTEQTTTATEISLSAYDVVESGERCDDYNLLFIQMTVC